MSTNLAPLQAVIDNFLDRIESALNRAVNGEADLTLWSCNETIFSHIPAGSVRSFIESLKIPASFINNHRPNFLLEDLALESAGDAYERRQRYQNIFHKFRHREEANGFGSKDLTFALNQMLPKAPGFTCELHRSHSKTQSLKENRRLAELILGEVLLARLLIFQKFISLIESQLHSLNIPLIYPHFNLFIRRWLNLQLKPSILAPSYEGDIFADLMTTIHAASPTVEEIHAMIFHISSTLFSKINNSIHGPHGGDIFLVLDEAQDAATALYSAFRSHTQKRKPRPVLRELVVAWSKQLAHPSSTDVPKVATDLPVTLVISGTGMSLHDEYNQMGGFEDAQDQKSYIRRYVPPEILSHVVGKVLLERMWYWLRGRYRFTAEFLAFLIENGYRRPNELLTRYIANFTRVFPSDCPVHILQLEKDPNSLLFGHFPVEPSLTNIPLQWDRLLKNSKKDETLDNIKDLTWKYIVTSHLENFLGSDEAELVQFGFARIAHPQYMPDSEQLPNPHENAGVIDETLVLWACAVWLNNTLSELKPEYSDSESENEESDSEEDVDMAGQPPQLLGQRRQYSLYRHIAEKFELYEGGHSWFEDYLMYYFCLAFSNPRREHVLGDIFDIMGTHAEDLEQKRARLVSVFLPQDERDLNPAERTYRYDTIRFDENGLFRNCGGTLGNRTGDNSGARARTWLAHQDRATFCFPDRAMGPDLLFVLELVGNPSTYIWVMVQAKRCGNQKYLPRDTLRSAIRSVTPCTYFKSEKTIRKASMSSVKERNEIETNEDTLRLLDELPGRETALAGRHSVLRVVASYSAISDLWKHFNRPRPVKDGDVIMTMADDVDESDDANAPRTSSKARGKRRKVTEVDLDEGEHPLATLKFDKLHKLTENLPPYNKLEAWKAYQARIQTANKNHRAGGDKVVDKDRKGTSETERGRADKGTGARAKEEILQTPKTAASNPVRRSTRQRKPRY
ncbi:hypothetical protein VNI00_003671 [Paramarasmius palmivorus]|uniref:Uncharacterized protein n=1 Tax=Paramarasmius palmivorus TaxID=297713 RepID=A0AAW0DVE1_9AGAR